MKKKEAVDAGHTFDLITGPDRQNQQRQCQQFQRCDEFPRGHARTCTNAPHTSTTENLISCFVDQGSSWSYGGNLSILGRHFPIHGGNLLDDMIVTRRELSASFISIFERISLTYAIFMQVTGVCKQYTAPHARHFLAFFV